MFRLPKVLFVGTLLPAVVAATDAVWLTTLLIMEATPPMGWICNSSVEALRRDPGSEMPSTSWDWVVIILGLKELLIEVGLRWAWPAFLEEADLLRKQHAAWWRHLLGWHLKQEVGLGWVEPMLILSGSSVSLSVLVGSDWFNRSLQKEEEFQNYEAQCGNCRNLLSPLFLKNYVNSTFPRNIFQ